MPRNIRATPDAAWRIRSVDVRTRYGPERVEQAYRILLGDGPTSDRQPSHTKEESDARRDLCQGLHRPPGPSADDR